MDEMQRTGIEVRLEYSASEVAKGQKFIEWMHKLHLNGLFKLGFDLEKMQITVDGVTTKSDIKPMGGSYFIECAPGEHTLEAAFGDAMGQAQVVTRRKTQVTVRAGEVTVVRYNPGRGFIV